MVMFRDRAEAGRMLTHRLSHVCPTESFVLAVARGGVPVGYEVGRRLHIPLNVLVVVRLTPRNRPGTTIGALAEDDVVVPDAVPAEALGRARRERRGRIGAYRRFRPTPPLTGRTAIIVDDGAVSGLTAHAACRQARRWGARRVVFATPVASADVVAGLGEVADELPRLVTPPRVTSVADWYRHFPPVGDTEAVSLLDLSTGAVRAAG